MKIQIEKKALDALLQTINETRDSVIVEQKALDQKYASDAAFLDGKRVGIAATWDRIRLTFQGTKKED